jgi:hypothetical protein
MLVAASTLEYAIPLRPVPWAKLGGNSKPAACPSFAAPVFGANLGISAQIVISNYDTLNRLTNIQDFQLQPGAPFLRVLCARVGIHEYSVR